MSSDPAATDPEHLLEHVTWLRGLARSLVGDRALADDLVQETWVAALRRPPDAAHPLRPWLRKVVTNLARFRWRGDANRAAREQVMGALAAEVPSTEELLARHETQQLLARLVTELEEPYRAAILLRYAEGLAPADIARRLGLPAGTVRWRLHEGLQRLRVRLDAMHRGDRRAWMTALLPLANRGAGTPATSTLPLGIVALALIAAAFAVWILVRSLVPAHPTMTAHTAPRTSVPASRQEPRGDWVSELGSGQPPGWIAQEGAPARRIAGRVVVDGMPRAGALVRLTSELSLAELQPVREQRTTAEGRFDFGVEVAREFTVAATLPGKLAAIQHVDLRDPTTRPAPDALELVLAPCLAAFHGKVLDPSGAPIAHAQLLREDAIGTTTDAAGSYELCMLPVGLSSAQLRLVVRADGYGAIMIDAGLAGRVHRDFILSPEATISGRAVTRDGQPVAHAKIWIERADAETRRETEQSARLITASDGDGWFRMAGLGGGPHRVGGGGSGVTAAPVTLTLAAGSAQEVVLTMAATGIVWGHVIQDGKPVAGARIAVAGGTADEAVSQLDGSFVLDRVPGGEVGFTALPYRVRAPHKIAIAAGARNDVVLEVEPLGLVRGTVRRHEAPVPYARVCAGGPRPRNTCAGAGAAGRFELTGLEPGDYVVFADDAQVGAFVRDVKLSLALGEHRALDLDLVAGARIAGEVVDDHGAPVAGMQVRFVRRDTRDKGRCVTNLAGRFACASMAGGGAYDAAVFAGEDAAVAFPFAGPAPAPIDLADGDAQIDGVHLVIDARRLAIRGMIVDATGAPVGDARVRAWGNGVEPEYLVPVPAGTTDAEGAFRIGDLAPGSYALEVRSLDGARRVARDIAAGSQDVKLVVDAAICRNPQLAGAEDPMRAAIVAGEPTDIAYRPPGRIVWDERIELLGWNLPKVIGLDQRFEVTLYYKVLRPIDRSWKIFLHFAGPGWHNADHDPLDGRCPTSTWQPGDVIIDRFTTRLAGDKLARGTYDVRIGFYTGWAPSWTNLPISEAPALLRDKSDGVTFTVLRVE